MSRAFLLILSVFFAFGPQIRSQHLHSNDGMPQLAVSEKSDKIDEFGQLGHCDFTSRIDNMLAELQNNSSATGYIIVYQGAKALPAQYEVTSAERLITQHINFRQFDSHRITFIRGGFREEPTTELWIVPAGTEPPAPTDTVSAPQLPKGKTFLFDRTNVLLDEGGELLREFELASVKVQREADEAEIEAENQDEPATDRTETDPDPVVDERTPAEREAERFDWISAKFGDLLKTKEGATGFIIFYADEQTYDIGKLQMLIELGRGRIAEAANIPPADITIEFGGYRNFVETEFWIVPRKGSKPLPTPEDRPVDDQLEVNDRDQSIDWPR